MSERYCAICTMVIPPRIGVGRPPTYCPDCRPATRGVRTERLDGMKAAPKLKKGPPKIPIEQGGGYFVTDEAGTLEGWRRANGYDPETRTYAAENRTDSTPQFVSRHVHMIGEIQ